VADPISAAAAVTVRPSAPALTTAGRWVGYLAWPWLFGVLLGGDWLLELVGYPTGERPLGLRLSLVAVAVVPGVLWLMTHSRLGQLRGFRRLRATPQPLARIDRNGIELSLPGQGVRRFAWEEVGRLDLSTSWPLRGTLVGTNGRTLALIPESLVHARRTWRSDRNLAQAVVEARPDRYAPVANWAGVTDAFALHELAQADPRAAERRRLLVRVVIIVGLGGATVISLAVWLLSQT